MIFQHTGNKISSNVAFSESDTNEGNSQLDFKELKLTTIKRFEEVAYNFYSDESGSIFTSSMVDETGMIKELPIHTSKYETEVELFGCKFVVSKEDGVILVNHQKFVLFGEGDELRSAIADLIQNIKVIRNEYSKIPNDTLDSEAFEFKKFLFETIQI